ncbi:MAG: hypothetical protein ABW185_25225, partial [Sedimenticola sp.]
SLNKSNYSPQMTEKNDSKWASLATVPILGQTPRSLSELRGYFCPGLESITHVHVGNRLQPSTA